MTLTAPLGSTLTSASQSNGVAASAPMREIGLAQLAAIAVEHLTQIERDADLSVQNRLVRSGLSTALR